MGTALCQVVMAFAFGVGTAAPTKPHVVFVLADDLGWNTAWNNPDIISPTLNSMAEQGLKLTSQYVYRYCSPTRAAFLTGRSPYKLINIRDNLQDEQMTDPRFTFLPRRLREAGYYSYHIGKWHLGMKAPMATPVGRGFQESYGFLGGSEDHFKSTTGPKCPGWGQPTDYFAQGGEFAAEGEPIASCVIADTDRSVCPLFKVIKANQSETKATNLCSSGVFANCAYDSSPGAATPCYQCFAKRYTGFDFAERAVRTIENHATKRPDTPMFMYLALQNTHGPIQAPSEYCDMYKFDLKLQNTFNGMVSVVDRSVENVTAALHRTGMWDNTLFIWTTDNGSPTHVGGSNAPLRGSKGVDWEGGIRVPAFVSGGFLPPAMGGHSLDGLVTIWDYFATICALAGVHPTEPQTDSPTPVDSFNVWPYLSGAIKKSPRNEIIHEHLMFSINCSACFFNGYIQASPCMGAGVLRVGDYKLLVGVHGKASNFGHFSPNASFSKDMFGIYMCSTEKPCLFNITDDMGESNDLSTERPEVVAEMLKRYHEYDTEWHPDSIPTPSEEAQECEAALHNGGFRTPWRSDEDVLKELQLPRTLVV
eukprot:TRINITY_DN13758_c0_g2_i1.p1 TRINITY_DN13758_c0_g2~~TRINITY_DN13758_c0_g2_i1.p1  ORF type:complete len:591 (+),score=85.03 TRINITY_DN13758_c0_g2_i1:57-1829(+)